MKARFHSFILASAMGITVFSIAGCQRDNRAVQAASEPETAEPITSGKAVPDNAPEVTNVIEGADRSFIMEAEKDNLQERLLGRLAAEKSQNPDVQAYGKMLSRDHNAALRNLVSLMSKYGIAQPPGLPEERKEAINDVKGLSGPEFDRAFIEMMVKDHEKAIADFQKEVSSAQNRDVRRYAKDQIPVLQKHLEKARDLQNKRG